MSASVQRRPGESILSNPLVGRALGCLALSFVLALMIGKQEGTQQDFGLAFRQAVLGPRILWFLLIGVLVFVLLTFWPRVQPYLNRPGIRPLAVGGLTVVVAYALLKWTDSTAVSDGKFGTLSDAASQTGTLAPLARTFFTAPLPWVLFLVAFAVGAAAVVIRRAVLSWVGAAIAVLAGVWAWYSHSLVQSLLGSPDHSTGALVALLGFLTIAAACAATALSAEESANTRGFINGVFAWRPGMPLVGVALLLGLAGFAIATWFSPGNRNATLVDTASMFSTTGLSPLSKAYLGWLGYVLFALSLALAAYAAYRRDARLGWGAAGLGLVSLVLNLVALHDISAVGASTAYDGATGAWQNLGTGGWLACATFLLLAGAGYIVATAGSERGTIARTKADIAAGIGKIPGKSKALILFVLAGALFYPPMATPFWQKVLVSEIGIYVLLAIGLNVVVGWAGLLDLGFIAFYAIGSYTTAYFVGALPIQPPEWMRLSPLLCIPIAIIICLIAGVSLGAPTLRLRGDYLAIVTLGFGEIIRIVAVNNPGNFTNGPRGAFGIPQPEIHLGPIHIDWGQASLQYWYLLLVIVGLVILAFNRLEQSRLGRAWAAIREDEVAAQATGVNTTRVKLLAFAIGASTSGVAGVFFASQIGYINPDNFVLNNSILVVAYVVFGGMGSLPGAMAGAAVLTWLPEFLKDQVPAEDRQMWIGAVILLMMIFRPAGLIPAKRRAAELHGLDEPSSAETTAVAANEGMGATK